LWEVVAEQLQIPLKPYTGLFPVYLLLLYPHRNRTDLQRVKSSLRQMLKRLEKRILVMGRRALFKLLIG
jgi:hypothetical protein